MRIAMKQLTCYMFAFATLSMLAGCGLRASSHVIARNMLKNTPVGSTREEVARYLAGKDLDVSYRGFPSFLPASGNGMSATLGRYSSFSYIIPHDVDVLAYWKFDERWQLDGVEVRKYRDLP